jgi:beta-glucosidase
VFTKGSNLDRPAFEEKATMFGKPCIVMTELEELLAEALKNCQSTDIIVAALGESAEMSGESSSRTNLSIPQAQKDLLQELLKTGKPVVLLVLFTGRPLVLFRKTKLFLLS